MISDEVKILILNNISLYMDSESTLEEVKDRIDDYLRYQGNERSVYEEELEYAIKLIYDHLFRLQEKHNFRSQLKTRSKSPFMRSFKTGRVKVL